jgi:hypothetical protein
MMDARGAFEFVANVSSNLKPSVGERAIRYLRVAAPTEIPQPLSLLPFIQRRLIL